MKTIRSLGAAAMAAVVFSTPQLAASQTVTLKLSHFVPPSAFAHSGFIVPWCDRIKQRSAGRMVCQIYPSMQLGGTPPQLYDQAAKGIADIAWGLPSYSPGRFPAMEVFDLPLMAKNSEVNNKAAWRYYQKHAQNEFADVHLIGFTSTPTGVIFSRKTTKTAADMNGQKMRVSGRLLADFVAHLGTSPVAMPSPQSADAISKGVVDGTMLPWDLAEALRIFEIAPNALEPEPDSDIPMLYSNIQFMVMNKNSYDKLPDDLKKIIDDNGGLNLAETVGKAWDPAMAPIRKKGIAAGAVVSYITKDNLGPWLEAAKPSYKEWVQEADKKGLKGQMLFDDARRLIDEASKQ